MDTLDKECFQCSNALTLQSPWPCLPSLTSSSALSHGRVGGPPRTTTHQPGPDAQPSPAAASWCVWSCSTRALLAPVALGARMVGPLAAWANAPRQRRARGLAPPARSAARRLVRGPAPQRRSSCSATLLLVKRSWPAWSNNLAKARRCQGSPRRGPVPSPRCCNGRWGASLPRFSRPQGGEAGRLRPHWGTLGSAWQPGAARRPPGRRRTPRSPEALCAAPARWLGRLRALLATWGQVRLVAMGCPAPAPGPHGRRELGRLSLAEAGRRGQRGG